MFKQRGFHFFVVLILTLVSGIGMLSAQGQTENKTKQSIGKLKVSLIFGTNGDVNLAGSNLKKLNERQLNGLNKLHSIKFTSYRLMGEDTQAILKRYVNWANPIRGSKKILLSFQPEGKPMGDTLQMDLELWQTQKKIMKSGATLKKGKPLYIQGPAWRGGKLIVAVELIELKP